MTTTDLYNRAKDALTSEKFSEFPPEALQHKAVRDLLMTVNASGAQWAHLSQALSDPEAVNTAMIGTMYRGYKEGGLRPEKLDELLTVWCTHYVAVRLRHEFKQQELPNLIFSGYMDLEAPATLIFDTLHAGFTQTREEYEAGSWALDDDPEDEEPPTTPEA